MINKSQNKYGYEGFIQTSIQTIVGRQVYENNLSLAICETWHFAQWLQKEDNPMPDIQHIIKLLKSDDPVKRINACEDLMALRQPLPPEAIDALKPLTNDPHPDVADMAQRVLAIDTNEKKWGVRAADMRMVLFWIVFGVIVSTAALGALLGTTKIVDKIVMAYHCPEAINMTEQLGPMVVDTDLQPIGPQLLGGTCTFADGSTKSISAREYLVTAMVGALGLSAIISVAIPLVFIPIYIWRKRATNSRR